jgi:hypothetical protein
LEHSIDIRLILNSIEYGPGRHSHSAKKQSFFLQNSRFFPSKRVRFYSFSHGLCASFPAVLESDGLPSGCLEASFRTPNFAILAGTVLFPSFPSTPSS